MDSTRRKIIHAALVRLADGDRSALDVLLRELWPVLLTFAEKGIGQRADAEDIAQEAFLKICSRSADFDRTRDGLSWAFGIVSYEIKTQRKRFQRRREVYDLGALSGSIEEPASQEEQLVGRELMAALEQAIGELTEADRMALGLARASEPAAASGPTQRKRKQRALDRLRGVWRSIYGEP